MNKFSNLYGALPYSLHFNESNLIDITNYENTIILDLIDTFLSISYHDFTTKRDENVNNRNILKVTVPVNNYKMFLKIKDTLQRLLKYMTNGEEWQVDFTKYSTPKKINLNRLDLKHRTFNSVALLSGGLDAFAGASQETNNSTVFVTFETNAVERHKAETIYEDIIKKDEHTHSIVRKMEIPKKMSHLSQRTRTLAFFASTFIFADAYKTSEIKVYENGIMSLNPRFYFRRYVTKTTHPKTIYLINSILELLNIEFKIVNPFNYLTKAQVINLIPKDWSEHIVKTRTCSKMVGSRAFNNRHRSKICHCGICMACQLRAISMLNSKYAEDDVKYMLQPEISNLSFITKQEGLDAHVKTEELINELSYFKFKEKKSLLEYYRTFLSLINSGEIFFYLDLNAEIFIHDPEYISKYKKMLSKFKNELDYYFSIQK